MELLPAVTAWLDSRTRVLKKQVTDLVTDPVGHVEKQAFNAVEDASNFVDKSREDPMAWVEVLAGNGMVGAFRPVGSKLLPSAVARIRGELSPPPASIDARIPRGWGVAELSTEPTLAESIQGKISDKALQKYGAPDFPLDAFLGHVRGSLGRSKEKYLTLLDPKELDQAGLRTAIREFRIDNKSPNPFNHDSLGPADMYAIRDALRNKTPLVRIPDPYVATSDILTGTRNLAAALETSKFTPDQLSKKSLEQLVSIGKKTEAAQLKEASVIKDFTISRSAQLNKEQGLPKGFVELKTQQDLGAETEFMNNCVGAGGAHPQTGKFLPKWHPITGEQITKGFAEDSGDKYWKRLQSGNERIFSYRPEGLPVATIRMDTRTGNVLEALGVENGPIPESMAREIKRFTDQKRGEFIGFPLAYKYRQMGSMDARRWDVPLELEALLRPHGPGLVQRAEWNRQDNLRRIQQILDDFRQFEAGDWMAE